MPEKLGLEPLEFRLAKGAAIEEGFELSQLLKLVGGRTHRGIDRPKRRLLGPWGRLLGAAEQVLQRHDHQPDDRAGDEPEDTLQDGHRYSSCGRPKNNGQYR